jgi:hypothetical protein
VLGENTEYYYRTVCDISVWAALPVSRLARCSLAFDTGEQRETPVVTEQLIDRFERGESAIAETAVASRSETLRVTPDKPAKTPPNTPPNVR